MPCRPTKHGTRRSPAGAMAKPNRFEGESSVLVVHSPVVTAAPYRDLAQGCVALDSARLHTVSREFQHERGRRAPAWVWVHASRWRATAGKRGMSDGTCRPDRDRSTFRRGLHTGWNRGRDGCPLEPPASGLTDQKWAVLAWVTPHHQIQTSAKSLPRRLVRRWEVTQTRLVNCSARGRLWVVWAHLSS